MYLKLDNGYCVGGVTYHYVFIGERYNVYFNAWLTPTGGTYSKVTHSYDKVSKRSYHAMRYQYKHIATVRDVAHELRINNLLDVKVGN